MEKVEITNLLNEACDLIADKQFEKASEILYKALKLDCTNIEAKKTLGLALVNLEKYEEAINFFKDVVKKEKQDANSWFYLALCYEKIEDNLRAENAYKKVISLRPEYLEAYKSLGVLYLKTGEYEKVIKKLSKIIVIGKDDYQCYYILASAYMAIGDEDKAAQLLTISHELAPEQVSITCNLTSCLIALGKTTEAMEYLKEAYKLAPDDAQVNFNLGTVYQLMREYDAAIEHFNISYVQNAASTTLASLASCFAATKRYESAYSCYKTLYSIYPDKTNFAQNYLNCSIELCNFEEALEVADKLIAKNPKSADLLKKKGYILRMLKKYKEAVNVFETLVKRGKIDYEVYYNLGISQVQMKDFEGGRDSLRKCVALEPENPIARKDLGILYLYMNFVDWALDELRISYELEPDNPEYVYNYAFCLHKAGSFETADEYYKKAIELDPKDSNFYACRADNLLIMQKQDEAVENYKKAITLNPSNVQANYGLAKVYFSMKKYAIAKEMLEDTVNRAYDSEVFNLLAICYKKLKEYEKAIALFKKLLEIYPDNHIIATNIAECYFSLSDFKCAKHYAEIALEKYADFEDALKILKEVDKKNE